jgi:catechol 2,3-dioxygenase-like lactoylglutathione lyase family enzyme
MKGIEHTKISVTDLDRSIEFYKKIGFKILRKTTRPNAMMNLGSDILEIIPGLDEDKRNGFTPPYTYHIAFYTDDIEDDVRLLNEQGIETTEISSIQYSRLDSMNMRIIEQAEPEPSDPKLVGCMTPSLDDDKPWKVVGFKDPDGIVLEIWQRR